MISAAALRITRLDFVEIASTQEDWTPYLASKFLGLSLRGAQGAEKALTTRVPPAPPARLFYARMGEARVWTLVGTGAAPDQSGVAATMQGTREAAPVMETDPVRRSCTDDCIAIRFPSAAGKHPLAALMFRSLTARKGGSRQEFRDKRGRKY